MVLVMNLLRHAPMLPQLRPNDEVDPKAGVRHSTMITLVRIIL
jgi:hypothetical protein